MSQVGARHLRLQVRAGSAALGVRGEAGSREARARPPTPFDRAEVLARWTAKLSTMTGRGFSVPPFRCVVLGPVVRVDLEGDDPPGELRDARPERLPARPRRASKLKQNRSVMFARVAPGRLRPRSTGAWTSRGHARNRGTRPPRSSWDFHGSRRAGLRIRPPSSSGRGDLDGSRR